MTENTVMIARVNQNGSIQQIEEHLRHVSEFCASFLRSCGFGETGKLLGLLHDLGKYSKLFQNYIRSQTGILQEGDTDFSSGQRGQVPHAEVGAWYWKEFAGLRRQDLSVLLEMPVMYHHGYLEDVYNPACEAPFLTKKPSSKLNLPEIYANIDPQIKTEIDTLLNCKGYCQEIRSFWQMRRPDSFDWGVLLRLLYSSLIDADRTDAAGRVPTDFSDWQILIDRMEQNLAKFPAETPLNRLRSQISSVVKSAAERPLGIYNLTIPTGGGKTLAGLRFALHHARKHQLKRVIYAAPFLSILEQNADEFRSILDDQEGKYVLECHSNILPEKKGEEVYSAISENWDAPVICTSTVQLLNAMFSGESRYARRFHQLSESVIIFDEIQSLPLELLHLFSRMVNFLAERMNSTVVLCSATQPQLDKLDNICNTDKEKKPKGSVRFSNPRELYPDYPELFRKLKRVQTEYIENIRTNEDILQFMQSQLQDVRSILLVCNTKAHTAELFKQLNEAYPDYQVYHLSTKLCPMHRKDVIRAIKAKLSAGERIIVCSTSLIEAGVNLSFEAVIRMTSSLDSVVQAAGRCNRNAEAAFGRVYILDNPQNVKLTASISRWSSSTHYILERYKKEPGKYDNDILSPKLLERYYQNLYYHLENPQGDTPNLTSFPVSVDGVKEKETLLRLLDDNSQSFTNYCRRENLPAIPKPHICGAFKTAGKHFRALDDIAAAAVIVPYGDGKEIIAELCGNPEPERFNQLLKEAQLFSVNITECEERKLRENRSVYEISEKYPILVADETCYDSENLGLGVSQGHLDSEIL